ncbi:MAG: competence/damage-inducible protein A, partial [Legionellales bacterium]
DEIVHGDTLNTNGHKIAHALSSDGLPLGYHLACSDKERDLINCLSFLCEHHSIIILIGGLGPTTDDLTRFALSQFTGEPLVQNQEALTHIEHRLLAARVAMNEGNIQQSLFPASATILPNPHGSAVGCSYQWKDKTFFLLPGPPRECLPMFDNYVLPGLEHTQHSNKQIVKWLIFGLAESEIGHTLEEALAHTDCQTGYRLDVPYIEFKVRCTPDLISTVKHIVDPIIIPHSIAQAGKKASIALYERIMQLKEPITIIDEATGGALQSLLVKPGTRDLVYFNNLKKTKLQFHLSGLDEYWSDQPSKGSTQVVIHYKNQTQQGGETHELPYRNALVIHYAAEWLSFRLLHLINQLHE